MDERPSQIRRSSLTLSDGSVITIYFENDSHRVTYKGEEVSVAEAYRLYKEDKAKIQKGES